MGPFLQEKMMKKTKILPLAAALVLLAGCGGGGGSEPATAAPDAEAAPATAENGLAAVEVIVNGTVTPDEISGYLPIAAVSGGEPVGFDALRFMTDPEGPVAKLLAHDTELLNATLYDEACSGGGSYTVTGAAPTATHMDMTGTFYNCREGEMTLDGSMHMVADGSNYGETISSMQVTFPKTFTMESEGFRFSIMAGSRMEVDYDYISEYGDIMAGTTTSSVQWSADGMQGRYDDFTVDFTMDNSGSPLVSTECYVAGTIYINNLTASLAIDGTYGCADPFTYVDMDLVSGSTRLTGAGGATINVTVVGDNNISVTDTYGKTLYYDLY